MPDRSGKGAPGGSCEEEHRESGTQRRHKDSVITYAAGNTVHPLLHTHAR